MPETKAIHPLTPIVPSEIIPSLELVGGVSDVGARLLQHPDNIYTPESLLVAMRAHPKELLFPQNVTAEYYRGQRNGESVLGFVGIAHPGHEEIGRGRHYVEARAHAGAGYSEVEMATKSFGSRGRLRNVSAALGIGYEKGEGAQEGTVSAVVLERTEDINKRLRNLGITDRKFVDFEGSFNAENFLQKFAEHEILTDSGELALHDRAFHEMGFVLLAPEVLTRMAERADTLLNAYKTLEKVIGGKRFDEFNNGEPGQYLNARNTMQNYLSAIDFYVPTMALEFGTAISEDRVEFLLKALGIEEVEIDAMTDATYDWVKTLKERATSLNS